MHAHAVDLALAGQERLCQLAPEQAVHAAVELVVAGGEKQLLPVADAAHGHVRTAERAPQCGGGAGGALRAVGLEEFAPGGRVVKQVAHDHRRALRAAGLVHVLDLARVERHVRAARRAAPPRRERDVRHGADGGQRLAAKAHRADGLEPLRIVQLARRVAQKRDARVLGRHAAAVVGHAQIGRAAAAQLHRHGAGPGVERVFHQLLDHGGGPLDDLARGDQIRKMRRENLNIGHGLPSFVHSRREASLPRVYYKGLALKIPPRNATIFYHTSNFTRIYPDRQEALHELSESRDPRIGHPAPAEHLRAAARAFFRRRPSAAGHGRSTYGCQQNEADSEKLRGYLRAMGFDFTQDEFAADVVVMNTCAVREHAETRVFGNVGALTHTKARNPEQIIAVCGCMAQQEHVAEKLKKVLPHR